jgi:excisionase family DNA binding protein
MTPIATHEGHAPLLKPAEAAARLAVNRKTAYRLIERGELDAVHVGTSVRIRPEDVAAYLERAGHR